MKDYNFEYTDGKFIMKLLGLSLLVFVALLLAMIVTIALIGVLASLVLAFGIPLLIFFLNKESIKKQGAAAIYDSHTEFKLTNSTEQIVYADIKAYQIERYNGTRLKIEFKDGKDFRLQANSNFCNSGAFDDFCQQFERVVQQYRASNNVALIRKPSIFEQAWMLPFLIAMTAALIGGILFAIYKGKSIPLTFYSSFAIVILLWLAYFNAKKRKQEQRN